MTIPSIKPFEPRPTGQIIPFDRRHVVPIVRERPRVDPLAQCWIRMQRAETWWAVRGRFVLLAWDEGGHLGFIQESTRQAVIHPAGLFMELVFLASRDRRIAPVPPMQAVGPRGWEDAWPGGTLGAHTPVSPGYRRSSPPPSSPPIPS